MKKKIANYKCLLALFMTIAIFWSNSLGAFAAVCPSPYSPNGYHDYSRHDARESAGTSEWDHDVYVGERSGIAVYKTCHVVVPFQWCETSCRFCGMPEPNGRHAHSGKPNHSLGCK